MCLGIPVRVVRKKGLQAETEVNGVKRWANLSFVPQAKRGDYVIIHAGFAIQILDVEEAKERLRLLRRMVKSAGDT